MSDPTNEPTSEPTNEPQKDSPEEQPAGNRGWAGVTTQRLVVWIVGGGVAIYLIVTGVVGILTKAR